MVRKRLEEFNVAFSKIWVIGYCLQAINMNLFIYWNAYKFCCDLIFLKTQIKVCNRLSRPNEMDKKTLFLILLPKLATIELIWSMWVTLNQIGYHHISKIIANVAKLIPIFGFSVPIALLCYANTKNYFLPVSPKNIKFNFQIKINQKSLNIYLNPIKYLFMEHIQHMHGKHFVDM